MEERKDAKILERRGFFKIVGLGAVAGVATLANTAGEAEAKTSPEGRGRGYQETKLVAKYYESAKF